MKEQIFKITVHTMVFWVMVDLFEGIAVAGITMTVILGAGWGFVTLVIPRLTRFLTLPDNAFVITGMSVILGIMLLTVYNFGPVGIDFTYTNVASYQSEYFAINGFELDMVGNIVGGGIILGLISSGLILLQEPD